MLISTAASAAGSAALRIVCDGDAEGAEVYVNGKLKGECPLDMKVPEGKLKLRVQKRGDAEHEPRLFEREIYMGDGVVKKVEVQLGPLELNAAGKRREEEKMRLALMSIEAGMVAIPGKNYAMGKTEVTQGQWKAVMGEDPPELMFKGCGTCPVERVSWNDIQEYLTRLSQKTGKQYRLPTEAEWEYACYGGSRSEYCGGSSIGAVAWYGGNSGGKTHPVGQKQANGYGLYDMSGNVLEWLSNCNGTNCEERLLRGGSWDSNSPENMRATYRYEYGPTIRNSHFGFRLARTLP
ncbi:SUMF1/EgtB/PvdO family nonheme iron enzyme [Candidatus Ferrigenium straubiae]|uniref:SUMF1/EgtB/PvdO family nonheme iron enzyme n=1 Tax=Candidatus Ferrigenium straubiae TaxID=2919506 RepID=UPI003F4AEA70